MSIIEIFALIIFLFPLAFSPGPGNMFFAANGARFGFVNTLSANFGYHLATIIVTFLIGFGFSLFFSFIEKQYQYIQIIGSLYVMYLAYKFFRAGVNDQNSQNFRCTFTDGVVLLVFNPKAYVIISLMFAIFLDSSQNILKLIIITLVFTINNFISFTLWTVFGDLIGAKFRNEKYSKILNNVFSLLLFLVGVWMLTIKDIDFNLHF